MLQQQEARDGWAVHLLVLVRKNIGLDARRARTIGALNLYAGEQLLRQMRNRRHGDGKHLGNGTYVTSFAEDTLKGAQNLHNCSGPGLQ